MNPLILVANRSHNHLSCTSITKSHMYYHEELAFTITINKGKCAGKATGDAGSIPACESKKTKRGGSPTGSEEPESIDFQVYLLDVILPMRVPSCFEYPNPSITCQSQRLEGPKAIPYLKREAIPKEKKREDRYSPPGQKQMHFCNRSLKRRNYT